MFFGVSHHTALPAPVVTTNRRSFTKPLVMGVVPLGVYLGLPSVLNRPALKGIHHYQELLNTLTQARQQLITHTNHTWGQSIEGRAIPAASDLLYKGFQAGAPPSVVRHHYNQLAHLHPSSGALKPVGQLVQRYHQSYEALQPQWPKLQAVLQNSQHRLGQWVKGANPRSPLPQALQHPLDVLRVLLKQAPSSEMDAFFARKTAQLSHLKTYFQRKNKAIALAFALISLECLVHLTGHHRRHGLNMAEGNTTEDTSVSWI